MTMDSINILLQMPPMELSPKEWAFSVGSAAANCLDFAHDIGCGVEWGFDRVGGFEGWYSLSSSADEKLNSSAFIMHHNSIGFKR